MSIFGTIPRLISLNRMTIRLNQSQNRPQINSFSFRNIITKQSLAYFFCHLEVVSISLLKMSPVTFIHNFINEMRS